MHHTAKMLDQNPRWDAKMTTIPLTINTKITYGGTYRAPSRTTAVQVTYSQMLRKK